MSAAGSLAALQDRLGYRFVDEALLTRALSHRSATSQHNERLEFLGDAILGYVMGEYLYRTRRGQREDSLTLLRSALVRRETLVEVAHSIDLGEHLLLGSGERRSGARHRASILADSLEAVIGAVHQDGGVEAARALVLRLFRDWLDTLEERAVKDAKTELQERLQARGLQLPQYRIVDSDDRGHDSSFRVACEVVDLGVSANATGATRKEAEKRAAGRVIEELEGRDR